jgi:prevent-host-death family protein
MHLAQLIEEAAHGEEVIITRNGGWAFKIVPIRQPEQVQQPEQGPKAGSAKGLIKMSDDFDEPLEFEDYVP